MESVEHLRKVLSGNASLRLLRNPHAVFILTFLEKAFKQDQILMIDSDLLQGQLAQFIESCGLDSDEIPQAGAKPSQLAKVLLDHWCKDEIRFLRRFADEEGRVWVELTPWTEKVFQWVDSLTEQALVGTESRFEEILQRLEDLLAKIDPDPANAVKRLEDKKKSIDEEIRRIKETGEVSVWNDLQLQERLGTLNRISRELLGDFKQVEQNFKTLVREIYARQSQTDFSRGDILGYTMDATEALRNSPQGRSFYAFWEHLIQDAGKESLRQKVEALHQNLTGRDLPIRDEILLNLKTHLHLAGRKVIAGNHLLAEKLNRLLSDREHQQREKVLTLLKEIKDSFVKVQKKPTEDETIVWVDGPIEVSMIAERPLAEPPTPRQHNYKVEREREGVSADDLATLVGQFHVDTQALRQRVQTLLKNESRLSLGRILELFPPEKGLSEILAYFEISSMAAYGAIDNENQETLEFESKERKRTLLSPLVEFRHE